jgi:hypothetical protein
VIVPVLNGVRHIGVLTERFGQGRVLGGLTVISLALAGVGIAQVHEPLARRYIREGSLSGCCPKRRSSATDCFCTPRRAFLAPKLRAFVEVAKKTLKDVQLPAALPNVCDQAGGEPGAKQKTAWCQDSHFRRGYNSS